MKRCKEFVFEADNGISFELSKGANNELIIKVLNNATVNLYSDDYKHPPIPEGYKRICGEWDNGYVIERIVDGSQFVWVPVGGLDIDGTLDGSNFSEKFGRRNFMEDEFSDVGFYEDFQLQLMEQLESVKKYGGFYFSRYLISKRYTGKPQSVKGAMPWMETDFLVARKIASTFEDRETVKSHLTFGAEYDSILAWFIKSNERKRKEIVEGSKNYWTPSSIVRGGVKTGSIENWCTNKIYDLVGEVNEWTQERHGAYGHVIRGGGKSGNKYYPLATRRFTTAILDSWNIGFRVALWIK